MYKRQTYKASSKVPGRIDDMKVEQGDRVEKGQLLYTLSTPELEAKLRPVSYTHLDVYKRQIFAVPNRRARFLPSFGMPRGAGRGKNAQRCGGPFRSTRRRRAPQAPARTRRSASGSGRERTARRHGAAMTDANAKKRRTYA